VSTAATRANSVKRSGRGPPLEFQPLVFEVEVPLHAGHGVLAYLTLAPQAQQRADRSAASFSRQRRAVPLCTSSRASVASNVASR
jgi:hypothetical protein